MENVSDTRDLKKQRQVFKKQQVLTLSSPDTWLVCWEVGLTECV